MPRDLLPFDLLSLSVTHELRQPLSVIAGYAELLTTRDLPDADRTMALAAIREAAARLAGSLDRLEHADGTERLRYGPNGEWEVLDLRVLASRRARYRPGRIFMRFRPWRRRRPGVPSDGDEARGGPSGRGGGEGL